MTPILFYGVPSGCSFGSIVALEWLRQPYHLCRIDMPGQVQLKLSALLRQLESAHAQLVAALGPPDSTGAPVVNAEVVPAGAAHPAQAPTPSGKGLRGPRGPSWGGGVSDIGASGLRLRQDAGHCCSGAAPGCRRVKRRRARGPQASAARRGARPRTL